MPKCPKCGGEMEKRDVRITYPNKKVKDDVVYVCNKGSCNGVFIPESIFGVGP